LTLEVELPSLFNNVETVLSTGMMVKNVIQDSTRLPHVAIQIHASSDKEPFVIHKMTLVVPILVKSLLPEWFVERLETRLAITPKHAMDQVRVVRKIKRQMMDLIVGMDYSVQVEFVLHSINNVDNLEIP
jgi:hypothetical protein